MGQNSRAVCPGLKRLGLKGRIVGGGGSCRGLGPCHLSALAERRPGLESGSSAGMYVLPSEGEERAEETHHTLRKHNTHEGSCWTWICFTKTTSQTVI